MVEINNKDAEKGIVNDYTIKIGDETGEIDTISASCMSTTFAALPESKSRLHLSKGFCFEIFSPRPNLWWRLWHWVFFGIKWEKL